MHGFTVTEVPVRHYPRIHGVSKYGMGNRLFKSLYDLIASSMDAGSRVALQIPWQ